MRLNFGDNPSFEYFQFLWFALVHGGGKGWAQVQHRLKQKLSNVSQADAGGGRVLIRPCTLEIDSEERFVLGSCIAETLWTELAAPTAIATANFIGISAEVSGVEVKFSERRPGPRPDPA